jgi:hypothetical protein
VAVKHTTVQVIRQPLYHELHEFGHDLLFHAETNRDLAYIVCVCVYIYALELHVKL